MCFAPQPHAVLELPNFQKCSGRGVFLPFPIFHPIFHPSFPYFPSNFPSNVHHQPTVFYFHPMAIINKPLFANIFYPNFNFLSNVRHQPTSFSIFHLNFHPMFAINLPSPIFSTQSSSSTNHLFLFCIRFSIQCSSSTNHCPIFHKIFHPMLITNEQCPIFSNQSSIQCSSLTNHFPYLPSNLPSNVHHEPTSFPYFPSNLPSNVHHAPTIVSIFLIRFPSNVHHRPTIAPICSIQFFLHQSTNFLFIFSWFDYFPSSNWIDDCQAGVLSTWPTIVDALMGKNKTYVGNSKRGR